jgi:hypothetical protein
MEKQDQADKDWKLKLRYGKLKTQYKHFTALAEGIVEGELRHGYECPPGNAWMGIKTFMTLIQQNPLKTNHMDMI